MMIVFFKLNNLLFNRNCKKKGQTINKLNVCADIVKHIFIDLVKKWLVHYFKRNNQFPRHSLCSSKPVCRYISIGTNMISGIKYNRLNFTSHFSSLSIQENCFLCIPTVPPEETFQNQKLVKIDLCLNLILSIY